MTSVWIAMYSVHLVLGCCRCTLYWSIKWHWQSVCVCRLKREWMLWKHRWRTAWQVLLHLCFHSIHSLSICKRIQTVNVTLLLSKPYTYSSPKLSGQNTLQSTLTSWLVAKVKRIACVMHIRLGSHLWAWHCNTPMVDCLLAAWACTAAKRVSCDGFWPAPASIGSETTKLQVWYTLLIKRVWYYVPICS